MDKFGYKWCINHLCELFIIKLQLFNSFHVADPLPLERYTTDCIVADIYRIRDNKHFQCLRYGAWYRYDYNVGQRITGNPVFFCESISDLLISQKNIMDKMQEANEIIMGLVMRRFETTDSEMKKNCTIGIKQYQNMYRPRNPKPLDWLTGK